MQVTIDRAKCNSAPSGLSQHTETIPPPVHDRLPELDRLRGLSILAIILCHSTAHTILNGGAANLFEDYALAILNQLSRVGVPAFVILSGILMSRLEIDRDATPAIVKRRLNRVIPPYLFWSSIYFVLFAVTGEIHATSQSLTMIYFEKLLTGTTTWQLYFLLMISQCYLLCLFGLGRKGSVGRGILLVCLAIQLVFMNFNYITAFWKPDDLLISRILRFGQSVSMSCCGRFIFFFLLGRLLGSKYQQVLEKINRHRTMIASGAVIFFCAALSEFLLLRKLSDGRLSIPEDWTVSINIFAVLSVFYLLAVLRMPMSAHLSSSLKWLGIVSFPLYLLHEPLLGYIAQALKGFVPLMPGMNILLQPVLICIVIILCSAVYFPVLRLVGRNRAKYIFG